MRGPRLGILFPVIIRKLFRSALCKQFAIEQQGTSGRGRQSEIDRSVSRSILPFTANMAALRCQKALRYTVSGAAPYLRAPQRRWAQVHDIRFLVTHAQPDRVLEKYKEKLAKKAKE